MNTENDIQRFTTLVFTVSLTLPFFVEDPEETRIELNDAICDAFGYASLGGEFNIYVETYLEDVYDSMESEL